MPLTTNATPYWDDYNEDKQFYRILFRPGYAVQARELTQLQTNLQKQIEYHGKHIFQHGSRVLDGQIAYNKCDYIKLADYTSNDPAHPIGSATVNTATAFDSTTLVGITIQLDSRTATFGGPGDYITNDDGQISSPDGRRPVAKVVLAENRTDNGDPATLLLNYESGDKFTANDFVINRADNSGFNAVVNNTISSSGAEVGRASYAGITRGVYFVTTSTGGYFAHVPKQRIILDKYSDSPTYKIGLKINETIVTEAEDGTLFDNAQGTYTTYAPGAHRLKIALDLAKAPGSDGITINPGSAKDFVEILRIENGQRAYGTDSSAQNPMYNILGEAMAKRTFDENGNYIVEDFDCRVEDGPADTVKVTVQPKPGKTSARAYIRGHQYEQSGIWVEYIQKARKTSIIKDVTTPLNHGAFMLVTDLAAKLGPPNPLSVGDLPIWDLHTCNTFQVNTAWSGASTSEKEIAYKSTRVGQFRVRDVQYVSANTHAIYITDFEGSAALTGNFSEVSVSSGDGAGPTVVNIDTANTSVWPNAYIGSKFTITWSHVNPAFAGQTRTVIASAPDTVLNTPGTGTATLTLDSPFNQPTSNTDFPGPWEKYSLNADIRAAATGNGCIIASTVNDSGTAIGALTAAGDNPNLPANKDGNANISKLGTIANTSIFGGGTVPRLLYKMPVGGARVANSIEASSTGTGFEFHARYSKAVSAQSGPAIFPSQAFRGTASGYTDKAYFKTDNKNSYTVINETSGETIGVDDFEFSTVSGSGDSITSLTVESTTSVDFGTDSIRLIGPVRVINLTAKRKSLLRGINAQDAKSVSVGTDRTNAGNSWITFASPNTVPGGKDNLGLVDVYRLIDVYDTGDLNLTANGAMLNNNKHRVTNNYVLDAGQSEALYDYASVVLKPGAKAPKGQLAVVVDRFIHDNSPDAGVFTVDSYNGQVSLENIPSFFSNKSGRRYKLAEYLDFRPSRAVETTSTNDANTSYYVPIVSVPTSTNHTSINDNQEILHPDSQGHFQYDMQFFAPRFDKIVLSVRQKGNGSNTGYMRIISGTDDRTPAIPPRVDPNDMALFTLALPSYTPRARDISVVTEGNRRWTMKDIGKINKRVDRLEYYSSLNMIEQDVSNLKIFDSSGNLERFKHGFIVDNFQVGTALADVGNLITGPNFDFQASIGRGVLRPAYESENIALMWSPEFSTGVQETDGLLHLPYTTVSDDTWLQQVRATVDGAENVNPFDVSTWRGTVALSPSSDIWKSTVQAEDHEGVPPTGYETSLIAMAQTLNDRMGASAFIWGEWSETWAGETITNESSMIIDEAGEFAAVEQAGLDAGWQAILHGSETRAKDHGLYAVASGLDLTEVTGVPLGNLGTVMNSFDLPGTDWVSYSEGGEGEFHVEYMPNQTLVFGDQVTTTVSTTPTTRSRQGIQHSWEVEGIRTEIGEFVINSSTLPFMRPIDIIFKVRGLKPDTVMFPTFDDVDIRNYTERANELVLDNTLGEEVVYTNPYINGEIIVSFGSGGGGRGIIAGFNPGSNTYYVTSANGAFNLDSTVRGSISNNPRKVKQYKNYSGAIQTISSADPLTAKLDDSAKAWWLPNITNPPAPLPVAQLEKDLFGKTLYITEGRGYGQSRTIMQYSSSGTVTLNTPWTITPNTQSRYSISNHRTNLSGDLYGVFHVPNYNWANRLISARQEGDGSEDTSEVLGVWEHGSAVANERTNDGTRFLTGNKSFSIRDSLDRGSAQSFGVSPFRAAGVIETRQKHFQNSFGLTLTEREVSQNDVSHTVVETTTETNRVEIGAVCWADPLAQTILVDPHRYPEGLFIDSVDLWFKTKPDTSLLASGEGIPVEVQIRPTTGGMPSGGEVMASVIKYPSEITVSSGENGDLPVPFTFSFSLGGGPSVSTNGTNFKFTRPVHLNGGTEYAIVILCADTSYEVWTAHVGSDEVGTGEFSGSGLPAVKIDSQPHLGVMLKSQNGSTWVPEVNQDLMFRIHKCKFDTSVVGSAIWKTANAMSHYVPSYTRVQNALAHTNWGNASGSDHALSGPTASPYGFKVWDKNFTYHRFRIDTTQLDYPSGFTGFSYVAAQEGDLTAPNIAATSLSTGFTPIALHRDIIPDTSLDIIKNKEGSFVLKGAISSDNEDISPMINLERVSLTMIKNLINKGELFANTWPANYITTDPYSSGNTVGGGFYIENAGEGYDEADVVEITTAAGNIGVGATGTPVINSMGSVVGVTLTNAGHTYLHAPSISITSPGGGTGAIINYVGEDTPQGPGNFLARYMTKRVVMSPGAEAKDIKIYLTAAQMLGTILWVYTKVRSKYDIESFNQKNWVLAKRMQPFGDELSPSEDYYREISFMGGGADDEFPLAYDAKLDGIEYAENEQPSGERFDTFNEFAIKIIMQSVDARIVPIVKDLRAIAVE